MSTFLNKYATNGSISRITYKLSNLIIDTTSDVRLAAKEAVKGVKQSIDEHWPEDEMAKQKLKDDKDFLEHN